MACDYLLRFRLRVRPLLVAAIMGLSAPVLFSGVSGPGAPVKSLELPFLVVGKTTYHGVRIVSHDARSVFFTYRDGMGSLRLRDLPPELLTRLGYDPLNLPPEPAARPPSPVPEPRLPERIVSANKRLEQVFDRFGTVARLAPRVSLREDFERLDLTVKFQGRRPSCAVYAMVSALEFQFFQLQGRAEDFSEEYLIWATRRGLGLVGSDGLPALDRRGEPVADAGYPLLAVARALATYGIALEAEMPSRNRTSYDPADAPGQTLVDLSRERRAILVASIPGEASGEILNNLVHVLNAGLPVPAGLLWSNDDRGHPGWLDKQVPVGAHAVTFVGYECPSCRAEEAVFVFKNSYGSGWGDAGYGRATWSYLARNLVQAYVIDARVLPSRK